MTPHVFQPLLAKGGGSHRLVNRSRDIELATVIEAAFDSKSRRAGLLGRETLPFDRVIAIAPSNAIHTFGMRFPLDILFIARDGVVVKRTLALKSRRVSAAFRAFAVLEFGAGHPGVALTQPGDRLAIEPVPAAPARS